MDFRTNIILPGQDILALALEHQVPVTFSKANIDYVNQNVEQEITVSELKKRNVQKLNNIIKL